MTSHQGSYLTDPGAPGGLARAVNWLESSALGPVALCVGVIAVAGIGFSLLSGRLPLRRGSAVLVGCFVVFAARVLAAGLTGISSDQPEVTMHVTANPNAMPLPSNTPRAYDPYAGASLAQ
jgi:type IV secretory pathway VirB2 component (pilin)